MSARKALAEARTFVKDEEFAKALGLYVVLALALLWAAIKEAGWL